jgi:hypothetical protein
MIDTFTPLPFLQADTLRELGLELIDEGVQPELTRWILDLLRSQPHVDLRRPDVQVALGQVILTFQAGERELTLLIARPGTARWWRVHPDGTRGRGDLGPSPERCLRKLFAWLSSGVVARV